MQLYSRSSSSFWQTPIGMTPRSILFDPTIFPDPHDFKPERWLAQGGQLRSDLDRFFVAFGKGARMCQGMKLAASLSPFPFSQPEYLTESAQLRPDRDPHHPRRTFSPVRL